MILSVKPLFRTRTQIAKTVMLIDLISLDSKPATHGEQRQKPYSDASKPLRKL
jgi:hypothetical protein